MPAELPNRQSIRLKGYDYSQPGSYFVTICTKNKELIFGKIENDIVNLTDIGIIAKDEWINITKRFPNIELNVFVIMPNHIHGIITIIQSNGRENLAPTLGNIVAYFKYQSTKQINNYVGAGSSRPNERSCNPNSKLWQRNYYEHIIRDVVDMNRIVEYIQTNPVNWEKDKLFIQ